MIRSVKNESCGLLRNCAALLSGNGFNEFSFSLTSPTTSLDDCFRFNPKRLYGFTSSNFAVCENFCVILLYYFLLNGYTKIMFFSSFTLLSMCSIL